MSFDFLFEIYILLAINNIYSNDAKCLFFFFFFFFLKLFTTTVAIWSLAQPEYRTKLGRKPTRFDISNTRCTDTWNIPTRFEPLECVSLVDPPGFFFVRTSLLLVFLPRLPRRAPGDTRLETNPCSSSDLFVVSAWTDRTCHIRF